MQIRNNPQQSPVKNQSFLTAPFTQGGLWAGNARPYIQYGK